MALNLQERLRQELRIEVEKEGALSPNLVSLLVRVLSEKGKPLNSQTRSSWSDFTFDIAEMLKVKEEQALPVAIAVELALLAGDIFDDLVDQDNQEAVWSTLSTEEAIIIANWIYTKAYSIINNTSEEVLTDQLKVKINQIFTDHMGQACIGQWMELNKKCFEMSEEEYLHTISFKSGKLIQMVFVTIATLSNQSPKIIHLCSEAGMNLGIASQIENDIIDLRSPNKSDLLRLSPSIPLIKAIESSRNNDSLFERNLKEWTKDVQLLEKNRSSIIEFIQDCGALDYTYIILNLYQKRAINSVVSIGSYSEATIAIDKIKKFMGYLGDEENATSQ